MSPSPSSRGKHFILIAPNLPQLQDAKKKFLAIFKLDFAIPQNDYHIAERETKLAKVGKELLL